MMDSLLIDGLAQTTLHPLNVRVNSAKGSYLHLENGRKILDFISGIGVSSFGHSHPDILKAIHHQVDQHLHVMVYGEFRQTAQDSAARNLLSLLPDALDAVYFLNSGAEAIDAAMKLARRTTQRRTIIGFSGGYHGNTMGALSVSSNAARKQPFQPLVGDVEILEWNDPHSIPLINETAAAVIVETVQGDAGIRIPDAEWIQNLREQCTKVNAMLILDEIQCGMGRTGRPFAFEHFDIVPDALCLGKALGGGLPMGALISSKVAMAQFASGPSLSHITTFGGHPVPCAASAVATSLLSQVDWARIERIGKAIEVNLVRFKMVQLVRRIGLYIAVQLESDEQVQAVVHEALNQGVLIFFFLSTPDAFRIAPPLTISDEELNDALEGLNRTLEIVQS